MSVLEVKFNRKKVGVTTEVVKVYKVRPFAGQDTLNAVPISIFTQAGSLVVGAGAGSAQELAPGADSYRVLTALLTATPKMAWLNILTLPDGTMINGKIVTSASSGTLTVSIQTADGNTPSTTNPVLVVLGRTVRAITSALTLTVAGGTNYMNLGASEHATKDVDVFAYLSYRAASTAVVLGFARIPGATLASSFSGTATNATYAAWTTAPAATDVCAVIGRFNVTLSEGAGYTWTIPATSVIVQYPIFETRLLTWAPTHSRTGTNYTNLPTTNSAYYKVKIGTVFFTEQHTQNGTPGGTNFQQLTLPFAPGAYQPLIAQNLSSAESCSCQAQTTTAVIYKYDGTAVAVASNVYVVQGEYRI